MKHRRSRRSFLFFVGEGRLKKSLGTPRVGYIVYDKEHFVFLRKS